MEKTEDLARPERILPTEPGSWYILGATRPVTLRWYDFSVGCDPVAGTKLCVDHGGVREPSPLTSFNPPLVFIAPIPTPEQLAAQAAQLAAAQAWADALRASQQAAADGTFSRRHILAEADARDAFMAALPPKETHRA